MRMVIRCNGCVPSEIMMITVSTNFAPENISAQFLTNLRWDVRTFLGWDPLTGLQWNTALLLDWAALSCWDLRTFLDRNLLANFGFFAGLYRH